MDSKTQRILDFFQEINRIPRCSKNEQQLAAWLTQWAQTQGFETRSDAAGNLVVRVPASAGFESSPTIVLQGHMDMVCEKRPDVQHDFQKDPIRNIVQGDWLQADGTSLGADNGLALALVLALVTDSAVAHPRLELLFTVDEETGLTGANQLDNAILCGNILLNIDSEDEGVFTVGCAGGINTEIHLKVPLLPSENGAEFVRISVAGLRGGHSGIDINAGRASANKVLARVLNGALEELELRLISFDGGTTHNAIARDAAATVALNAGLTEKLMRIASQLEQEIRNEFAAVETGLKISVEAVASGDPKMQGAGLADTLRMVNLLMGLPHGVARMATEAQGLVDTSNNLATVSFSDEGLQILCSQRSVFTSRVKEISDQVAAVARLAGACVKNNNAYPAWQPRSESPVLKKCQATYTALFGTPAKVEIIHAGLECAVIGSKYPEMDMISLGPTMKNPHSPDERLYIPSIDKVWRFMVALLASYADERSNATAPV